MRPLPAIATSVALPAACILKEVAAEVETAACLVPGTTIAPYRFEFF